MNITEVKAKHTADITNQHKSETVVPKLDWRKWYIFPRWDIAYIIISDTEDKQKYLDKVKDNLICHSTFSGKHNITYWKYYKTADDYAKDHPDPIDESK